MAKKYHKEKCNSRVRAVITFGNTTITLLGIHSFEWSVVKENNNKIVITTFHNRKQATEEFNKYK